MRTIRFCVRFPRRDPRYSFWAAGGGRAISVARDERYLLALLTTFGKLSPPFGNFIAGRTLEKLARRNAI